eukprot:1158364-Pelagomonas_calceolata.AAC.2
MHACPDTVQCLEHSVIIVAVCPPGPCSPPEWFSVTHGYVLIVLSCVRCMQAFIPETGKGIQGATSHCLGQNFSRMFKIEYETEQKTKEFAWQGFWRSATRSLENGHARAGAHVGLAGDGVSSGHADALVNHACAHIRHAGDGAMSGTLVHLLTMLVHMLGMLAQCLLQVKWSQPPALSQL